ncbi:hypothetical protein E2L08_14175 [Palleronia sediminis]|uniref:DAGKc domain-containing protein n=1 Tax=Palleronia sediminis TaxID=2547833 RepID=A0A4R6A2Q7_9RHOB|nr:diacylglycerol kinase family protein [Palleronia sediminis]TDL76238.1 hypothetical protein E2L08_14175 [Palleronia sediminis]
MAYRIALIANRSSGQNSRDAEAIDRCMAGLGPDVFRLDWEPGSDMGAVIDRALAQGAERVVAAGGDGTVMAVAGAMLGRGVPLGVLPLGTFNFFARGLGLSEDPDRAARQIVDADPHEIRVGMVNGRPFLNNASLGIYPAILKERETVYSRWGRFRTMAYWSVGKTFLRYRKPMKLTLRHDGMTRQVRTALLFAGRSAYQLELFGIAGADAIDADRFAFIIARADTRLELFRMAARLALRKPLRGRDYELLTTDELSVETATTRALLAFDGEKSRDAGPFRFHMSQDRLTILLPRNPTGHAT